MIFPRFLAAALIFGLGWTVTRWWTNVLSRTLSSDNVPHATEVAHYAQIMLLAIFAAMALLELNIAREVVLIGFTTIIVMLAAIAVVLSATAGKSFMNGTGKSNDRNNVLEDDKEQ